MMKRIAITFLVTLVALKSFGQNLTLRQIEDDLRQSYKKITAERIEYPADWDSLEVNNLIFGTKLARYTAHYPETLTFKFDSLRKDHIHIAESEDSLFRIYSWNTNSGGTMQGYSNVFQFKIKDSVCSAPLFDTGDFANNNYIPFYSQVFTLKADRTYYLAVANGIYSTKDASQSIKVFSLENGRLNENVPLIKSEEGITGSVDLYFDFFSVADRPERPLRLIKYNAKRKMLYIPKTDDKERVTKKLTKYKFNGQYFEQLGR